MGPGGSDTEFADALERLRRTGMAVLIAGAVPDEVHRRTCGELLGGASRDRLLVRADGGQRLCVESDPADRVIEYETSDRSGAVTAGGSVPSGSGGSLSQGQPDATGGAGLPAVAGTFEDALAAVDATGSESPRVCVDSVVPLVDGAGEPETFRFLHLVTGSVRSLGGACFCHLSGPADGALATTFEALVDATVELRLSDDRPEQRWTIHQEEVQSAWLPLDVA